MTFLSPAYTVVSVYQVVLVNAQEVIRSVTETRSVTDVAPIWQALREGTDVVICDTSGRLHTNYKLMEELAKSHRAIQKKVKGAPHEVLLVLDGTTGAPPPQPEARQQPRLWHPAMEMDCLRLPMQATSVLVPDVCDGGRWIDPSRNATS